MVSNSSDRKQFCERIIVYFFDINSFVKLMSNCEHIRIILAAETGSGKTCAFALPAIQICYEYQLSSKNERPDKLGALKVQSLQFEMSLDDRDKSVSIHPSSSGLHIQTRNERNWVGCRCNTGIGINVPSKHNNETLAKKLYFECTIKDEGAVRLGYSTAEVCDKTRNTD